MKTNFSKSKTQISILGYIYIDNIYILFSFLPLYSQTNIKTILELSLKVV